MERYGDYNVFYNRCSAQDFIIILVMTKNRKRFGGFSDIPMKNSKNTINSFCFSFDYQKLYYDTNYVEWKYGLGPKFSKGFCLGFQTNYKKCLFDNKDFGFLAEDFFDYEAHRIYLE